MTRLIDADKIRYTDVTVWDPVARRRYTYQKVTKEEIDREPTVLIGRRGFWMFNMTYRRFECSICSGKLSNTFRFCPFCGSENGTEVEDETT